MSKKNETEVLENLLNDTTANELQHSLSNLILHCDTSKLSDMDKLNIKALNTFFKQLDD